MLLHLFRTIATQWKSNLWIGAELFVSFICLWVITSLLIQLSYRNWMDKGFDIQHVYRVYIAHQEEDTNGYRADSKVEEELRELADRIRRYPGVEAAGFTDELAFPYTVSNSGRMAYHDTLSAHGSSGKMTPDVVSVFRYCPVDNRINLRAEAVPETYLVSRSIMDKIFPGGAVKGYIRTDEKGKDDKLGIAVTSEIGRCEYFSNEEPFMRKLINEERFLKSRGEGAQLFFRVRPEADHDFLDRFYKEMKGRLQVGNSMVTTITPMPVFRKQVINMAGIDFYYTFAYLFGGFFLFCAFLGVIGTFWFRTEARRAEIGLRMALGASRRQVQWEMVGEGLALFASAWLPGIILLFLLRSSLFGFTDYALPLPDFLFFLLISVMVTLLLALLIIAGIWYPARQASRINPVDALHYE